MKTSISNLAWGAVPVYEIAPKLKLAGIDGIEIAPTALWNDFASVSNLEIVQFREYLSDTGLEVSGIQSLFFGHPEFQLFVKSTWPLMQKHLIRMIELGGLLQASVAVFGSPRNRLKGSLSPQLANEMAMEFFSHITSSLEDNNLTLSLEPNAPEYGADYLNSYSEVVELSKMMDSNNIGPQIDTGCLWMYGEDPAIEFLKFVPRHIHLSTPHLGKIPGSWNFDDFIRTAKSQNYNQWLVIETLGNTKENAIGSAKWLTSTLARCK